MNNKNKIQKIIIMGITFIILLSSLNLSLGKNINNFKNFKFKDDSLFHSLELENNSNDNLNVQMVRYQANKTSLQDGWPVNIGFWSRKPVVADLNNDGDKELIIGTGDGFLHVLNHDGTYYWGQPMELGASVTSPAIADLNNDGVNEIIICVSTVLDEYFPYGRVFVFNPNGSLFNGWPKILEGGITDECSPSIGDIDNDDDQEIIIGTGSSFNGNSTLYYKKVYAFHHNGEIVDGWPIELSGTYTPGSTPILVDLDSDKTLEIIIGSLNYSSYQDGALQAFHYDGSVVSGFPFFNDYWDYAIAAGDVNDDGDIEILTHALMIDESGNLIEDWEKQQYVISYFALADINNDGLVEIVYGLMGNGILMVVDHHGIPMDGWPQITQDGDIVDGNPVVGDIDGDGDVEILIGTYYSNKLFAWHHNGDVVDGFPIVTNSANRALLLSDLDNDGDVEIVSCCEDGYVFVWDLPGAYNATTMEWPMFQHDPQHTGLYVSKRPYVRIEKPQEGYFYIRDNILMHTLFGRTIIIGPITIKPAIGENTVKAEFYIDNILKETIDNAPFEWVWNERVFGRHDITVKVYDESDRSAADSINVIIFNLGLTKIS